MTRLENWTLMNIPSSNGCVHKILTGNVYGHPKADEFHKTLTDGNNIVTSNVVFLDLEKGIAITNSGTEYHLGVKK